MASGGPPPPLVPTAAPGTFSEQNLAADRTDRTDRTDQSFIYRVPSLASLGNGVVVAAWDGRPGITTIAAGHVADATSPQYGYSDSSLVVDAVTGTVFAFFVYSKDQGFAGSQYGNDHADRSIISAAVVSSNDGGVTSSAPRLITSVVHRPRPGSTSTASSRRSTWPWSASTPTGSCSRRTDWPTGSGATCTSAGRASRSGGSSPPSTTRCR